MRKYCFLQFCCSYDFFIHAIYVNIHLKRASYDFRDLLYRQECIHALLIQMIDCLRIDMLSVHIPRFMPELCALETRSCEIYSSIEKTPPQRWLRQSTSVERIRAPEFAEGQYAERQQNDCRHIFKQEFFYEITLQSINLAIAQY